MSKKIGRYEIVEELGRGAMGVVYLGRDPVIDRKLAIKTIRIMGLLQDDTSGEYLARFYQEARAAGKLSHPGIVTIFDVGQDPETGMHFIVMEYVPGPNLKSILTDPSRTISFDLVARIGANVADALAYAHRHQVIHRDIKPANIILSSHDVIKITDFGIAKLPQSELTSDGQFVGTPSYMSPEQIRGLKVDNRSDIFSLGIVLYEMVARAKPFPGDDLATVSHKIAYEPHQPLKEVSPDIPPELSYGIDRALSKEPERRFQDAMEMAELFRSYLLKTKAGQIEKTQVLQTEATVVRKSAPTPPGPTAPTAPPSMKQEQAKRPPAGPVSSPARQPGRKTLFLTRYRNFKSRIADHPTLYFLALPIYWHWVALILAGTLLVTAVPIALIASKINSQTDISISQPSMERVALRKALLKEAEAALAEGKPELTLQAATTILADTPLAPYPALLYKKALDAMNNPDNTVESQEDASGPIDVSSQIARARVLYDQGEYSDAERVVNEALAQDPANREARQILAMISVKKEMLKQKYQTPVSIQPESKPKSSTPASSQAAARLSTIQFNYDSPIGEGFLMINANGKQVFREEFDFVKKSGLFKTKTEFLGGSLKGSFALSQGEHSVQIWVVSRGKDKVNTYTSEKVRINSRFDYSWNIILDAEANKVRVEIAEEAHADSTQ
ncbi:MAG TPA: protein kinase [Thermoanaerobaculia bacterium]|nr:protein kinase [Thermoanaerobaculia bacterium]HUM28944.1 protein kinase [Thermoanaerobaculia bacterium]HXK67124.1 protein kinase [Thermoanaerobaculia bacterium]